MHSSLFKSEITSLKKIAEGKVRDIYAVDEQHMLIVTTDRLSAFDVILPDPIPKKGQLLTEVSNFWFKQTEAMIPNHLTTLSLEDILPNAQERAPIEGRGVVVKKLKPLPIEAVVRGYIIGSGWKDYQSTGEICGIKLSEDLQQAEKFAEPLFTPATKAAVGDHDENINFAIMQDKIGIDLANQVKDVSIQLYCFAANYAAKRGIIIADTKFEFGLDENDQLVLIDEILTPDSSRFWPETSYAVGISPPSFDKQYVRDYLETLDWNKTAPGPNLPEEVISNTAAKYQEARDILLNN